MEHFSVGHNCGMCVLFSGSETFNFFNSRNDDALEILWSFEYDKLSYGFFDVLDDKSPEEYPLMLKKTVEHECSNAHAETLQSKQEQVSEHYRGSQSLSCHFS